jgi:hypothetical protein
LPAAPPDLAATIQQVNGAEAGGDPYACMLRARALELITPAADPAVLAELELELELELEQARQR